ncbi:MarR family winged helix-turn-helix transcriptional regulator [Sphingomonas sp. G124]|uniref:MarR family winged helix-turn-helix transcriptional regulator n=1 Tax=Sphingomonas cremea TaxID=2904799 RepID=A0A9X1QLH4_9SPHN|nr:MarR family winged helix-turn-helix transcriptional regulator [Sphingomonas cremea]MCF2515285.1 MarR family winged helix-turn-helix transcriptional regulator [Sphingomonas cremea]
MALRKASRAVTRLYDDQLSHRGMTTTQFAILGTLDRRGDLPLTELAAQLVMDRTSLYRTLAPVERAGWVSIVSGPGRSKTARLTDSGRSVLQRGREDWAVAQEKVLGDLPEEEWEGLLRTLNRLIEAAHA